MFQLVSDLTVYQKYKIVASYEFRGLYVGSVELDTLLQFVNLEWLLWSLLLLSRQFYAFVSDQPQWKMERRAVNLIVRRLLGDDCFEWWPENIS